MQNETYTVMFLKNMVAKKVSIKLLQNKFITLNNHPG